MDQFTEIETSKALTVIEGSLVVRQTALDLAIQHSDFDPSSRVKDEDLEAEHASVEAEYNHVDGLATRLRNQLETFSLEMNNHPLVHGEFIRRIELSSAIEEAQGKLLDLRREAKAVNAFNKDDLPDGDEDEREERERLEDDEDDYEDEEDEERAEYDKSVEREAKSKAEEIRGTRNVRRLCKAIWNKIAGRTHPDKTKDTSLHELFQEARKCYDRLDLDGLAEIWDAVSGDTKSRKAKIRAKLEKLRQALKRRMEDLSNLTSSDAFMLMKIASENGGGYAAQVYARNMRGENQGLSIQLDAVKFQIQLAEWEKRMREDPDSNEPRPSQKIYFGRTFHE